MNTISTVPCSLEWLIYKGDTAALTIIMTDSEGEDLDISNFEFAGSIKSQPEDEEPAQTLGITTNENILTVIIPDSSILDRISYFDIESVNTVTDEVVTIIKGRIVSELDITR